MTDSTVGGCVHSVCVCGYQAELERLRHEVGNGREVVVGWREWDWPEGFDRRTAELIAEQYRMMTSRARKETSDERHG